jgi:hypothetical protein
VWKLHDGDDAGEGVQPHDVQGAHGGGGEHLERTKGDEWPESGVGLGNLQGAQATTGLLESGRGEHLERRARGEPQLPITVDLVLEEVNRAGSEPARQAELLRSGETTRASAAERITRTILRRRGLDANDWREHAPAVEAALTHSLDCECAQCR